VALSARTQRFLRIGGTVLVLGLTALLWKASGLASGGGLAREAAPYLHAWWTPLLVLLLYVAGAGIAFFPILPLIIATGLLFPPGEALAYSLGGSLAAAAVGYVAGRRIGPPALRAIAGPGFETLDRTLRDAGFLGVAAIRLFPAAPYTVIGLVAGAARVRFGAYVAGTLVGLLPGVLIFSLLGYQIRSGEKLWLTAITLVAAAALGAAGWLRARRKQRARRHARRHRHAAKSVS